MSREEKYGSLVQQVSTMLLEELTQGGQRNLTGLQLDDLENEVFRLADSISQGVAEGLLERQAESLGKGARRCPCCQAALEPKPPQERTLLLRRGEVQWEEPVWRCPPCRRDFFPSVGSDGLCGRDGVQPGRGSEGGWGSDSEPLL